MIRLLPRAMRRSLALFVALLFAAAASAYDEPAAVKALYPDPPVAFATPGFAAGRADFTSHEEMMAFIERLRQRADNLTVRILGESQEGRAIPLLLLTNARTASPADVLRLNRPVVWLQGLQHGDEPAGGEAMLVIAEALALGELKALLDRITVLIVPRANPDGAARSTRRTANGIDINRDHVKFDLPETVALHRVMNEYQPQVVVDCHEFAVYRRWLEKWNVINAYDMTLLYATNANVPRELTLMADELYRAGATAALERNGYRHFWYYTTSYNESDKRVQMGGIAADIARNTFGLQGAVSFLLETRGLGIGREHFRRRVATHYVALQSMLETTASNAARVQATVARVRAEIAAAGSEAKAPIVVTAKGKESERALAMLDPATGEEKALKVRFEDTLETVPEIVRPRPFAYVLPASYREIARKLALNGVQVQRLARAETLDVEAFQVSDKKVGATTVEGHIRVTVTTTTTRKRAVFPAGTYVVAMGQPNALLAAVALEPESASSFVSIGAIPIDKRGTIEGMGSEVPVYRLTAPTPLSLFAVDF